MAVTELMTGHLEHFEGQDWRYLCLVTIHGSFWLPIFEELKEQGVVKILEDSHPDGRLGVHLEVWIRADQWADGTVTWCPRCDTMIKDEEVVNGACANPRRICGTQIEQKRIKHLGPSFR